MPTAPGSATSIASSSRVSWTANGRTARAATSSIRQRSCATSAGPPRPNGSTAPAPRSPICCGCRVAAAWCRRSRSRTTRWWQPSTLLDEVEAAGLDTRRMGSRSYARIFEYEALGLEPVVIDALAPLAAEAAQFRLQAPPATDPRFRGSTSGHVATALSLSALERYQDCPFKFFAADVLRLEEPPEDEPTLSPRARGRFIHEVFQRFFEAWDARGDGTITSDRIDEARALFEEVAAPLLARLPEAEAALERARLFGSAISVGIVDVVLGLEASRPAEVRERWLEHRFEGEFSLGAADGRRVALKGVADRIDLLDGNRLRVIDYKSGYPPEPKRALQVPIYALCAQETLAARDGAAVDDRRGRRTSRSPASAPLVPVDQGRRRRSRRDAGGRARPPVRACSTASAAASFRRGRTSRGSAATAPTRRSAGRTTSVMSNFRAAVRRANAGDGRVAHRRARSRGPRARRRSALQRRARGVGRHRQDARARRPLRQPAAGRRRSVEHPGHHLHAQGGRRDARAHHGHAAAPRRRAARSRRRAGASCAIARRTSPSAPSTRSACRCCASSRSRPTSIPGFSMADDTEVPRLIDEALDRALRICRSLAREDENVALVFAQLGERRARAGLAALLNRRLVAPRVLSEYLAQGPARSRRCRPPAARAAAGAAGRLRRHAAAASTASSTRGPPEPAFLLLARALRQLRDAWPRRAAIDAGQSCRPPSRALREHFLTQDGRAADASCRPRRRRSSRPTPTGARIATWSSSHAPAVAARRSCATSAISTCSCRAASGACSASPRPSTGARSTRTRCSTSRTCCCGRSTCCGRWRSSRRAATVSSRAITTCSSTSSRTPAARSGSWCRCWSSRGAKAPASPHAGPLPPSIFIVGDRKQSIYGFRDADVSVLQEAARHLEALRPDGDVRRSISRSFRSVPALLAFVNDVCHDMDKAAGAARRVPVRRAGSLSDRRADAPESDATRSALVLGATRRRSARRSRPARSRG